jgi:exonuclease SbcC
VLTEVDGGDLDAAQKRYDLARRGEAEARASLTNATSAAAKFTANLENAQRQIDAQQALLTSARAAATEVLPAGQDAALTAVEAALREQTQARTARLELEAGLKQTAGQAEQLRVQLAEARRHSAGLEQRSLAAAEALEAAQQAAVKARDDLVAAAAGWPDAVDALRRDEDAAPLLRSRLSDTQTQNAALVKSMGQLEVRIEHLQADVERANELRGGLAALRQEHNVSADLAQMLGAARFQTYVQQEALRTLAACGSQRLEQLSGGRYKLQLDEKGAEFEVVDLWNADMTRSVKTLSGGETFLASLALSLALAESLPSLAAGRRVVLDSIFLDEGFGSLDAEALDRAADALDALRLENRMVCIVTHLPELAQRLPARIVVTKTEAGSTAAIA